MNFDKKSLTQVNWGATKLSGDRMCTYGGTVLPTKMTKFYGLSHNNQYFLEK